ncbi:MAG: peptide chain release factor N(5)-glutamine methyltransferase [Bacteriovoracaceae bacterium]|nr:peptide chain release factor N(5)-glutamine methyltransferase [Bacteriovoracaceae bacterium]
MNSIQNLCDQFFERHKSFLVENYPGIRKEVLIRELEGLCDFRYSREDFKKTPVYSIPENQMDQFFSKLLTGMPLEYITGYSHFYGLEFEVNDHVLIPRSETEFLVEKSLEICHKMKKDQLDIFEVGTGSGAIAISLAANLNEKNSITAGDISTEALGVAKSNYSKLLYQIPEHSQIKFIESDRLTKFEGQCDFLVSNPPYIKSSQRSGVHKAVDSYEPHLALYLDDEQYRQWYIHFFEQIFKVLKSTGQFLIEGHENNLEQLANWSKDAGLGNISIEKDLCGKDRFLKGSHPNG